MRRWSVTYIYMLAASQQRYGERVETIANKTSCYPLPLSIIATPLTVT
jgi:hypothetical protein